MRHNTRPATKAKPAIKTILAKAASRKGNLFLATCFTVLAVRFFGSAVTAGVYQPDLHKS